VSIDGTGACEPPVKKRDPFLVRRADGNRTIIAGYPWFTDWGRDTMISLPGLLIAPGRLEEAREILETFLARLNNGLLPNRFSDAAGGLPEYNTGDATLWMFQALRQWLEAGGDRGFLRDKFYPAAREIIEWHRRGTHYNIHVDPEDHLLFAGWPGTQLTWMDAKVGDWVVTPRHGKPVEINALWHGALRLMSEWAQELQDAPRAQEYREEADAVEAGFRRRFWNESRQCLYDVITADGPVTKVRPNQIFAVSLPHALLDRDQQQAVVRTVERQLLTPVGLRTLERGDPEYKPHYQGSPWERDAAYHQGTVWPWLLGPFVDAYLNAFGKTPETLEFCRGLIESLEAEAAKSGCVNSIAEIYDAEEPRRPRGCPAQAWSVAEAARVRATYGW
jgi:predicted glycogen debranching enzyme